MRWYETDEFSANNYTRVFKTAKDALTFVRQLADPKLYSIYIADEIPQPRLAVSNATTATLDCVVLSEFTTMEAERKWAELVTAQLAIRNSKNNPLYYWIAQAALGQLADNFQVYIRVEGSSAVLQVVLIDGDNDEIVLQRSNSCETPMEAIAVVREWMNPAKWVVHDEFLITVEEKQVADLERAWISADNA